MHESLKSCLADLLARPRSLKPQAERQIVHYLEEHGGEMAAFIQNAAGTLEDHELEIFFAPQFTPAMDDQAAVSDILAHWRPAPADLARLENELCAGGGSAAIQLPDGTLCRMPLHPVLVERFLKLLRLDQGPAADAVAILQDALPSELYRVAAALMRQRGFGPDKQAWYAAFVRFMARKQPLTAGVLAAAAEFIVDQPRLEHDALLSAARNLVRAAKGAAEYAQAGRMYWSPDVAQHHQNRGEGRLNQALVQQRLDELGSLETMLAALEKYGDSTG